MAKWGNYISRGLSSLAKASPPKPFEFPDCVNVLKSIRAPIIDIPLPKRQAIYGDYVFPVSTPINRDLFQVDEYLMENGILLEDVLRVPKSMLSGWVDVGDLHSLLYGKNPYPIPLNPNDSEPRLTQLRRQLLTERVVGSRSTLEYRLHAEEMLKRGLMVNLNDNRIKTVWNAWVSCFTQRISDEIAASKSGPQRLHFRTSAAAKRAASLIANCGLSPDKIATVVLVTSTSEICNPDSSRSTVTGRGSGIKDLDELGSGVKDWTNCDIESSMADPADTGRAVATHLCDLMGTSVQFAANAAKGRDKHALDWSQEDRLFVGSELVRWMVSECMVPVDAESARREVNLSEEASQPMKNGKYLIDPEQTLFSFLNQRPVESVPENSTQSRGLVLVNAFKHSVESRGFKSTGYISLNPMLVEKLSRIVPRNSFFRLPPMLIPPAPWGSFWECGYLTRRFPLIRFTGSRDGSRDAKLSDMSSIRACMDYLGSTKWVVNKKVLDLIEEALLVTDRVVPGIPKQRKQVPPPASEKKAKQIDRMEKRTELMRKLKEKQKLDSEEPILLSKLDVARQFRNASGLYFPHSVDFRGRAYPIPAPFNHQGDDITRAMLKFGEKRKLGERGWFWLRINCANAFGKDKLGFSERIQWVDANMEKLMAVAQEPLSKSSIDWISKQTDDFWQAVAVLLEIADAVNACGPCPHEFESSLPIQQDGSCNGLQHYAALGRDKLGALAVNVAPSNKVEDVYSVVLGLVRERVQAEASTVADMDIGALISKCPSTFDKIEEGKPYMAQLVMKSKNVLQRRTVKQTVMTICYGVTQIGASDQVAKQLNDLEISKQLSASQMAVLSSYLARLTLSSIDTVFAKAMEIKRWFDQVAAELNKHKLPVCWISPAGVPCRQPYRKQTVTELRTPLQKINVVTEKNFDESKISGPKQRMGFPPNFIHSLDASHMILTALECKKAGIVFASVHDSFWTHAADVDVMNVLIRREFYKMYNQPILQRLRDALVLGLGEDGANIPPLPEQGDLDLKCVLESPYFFD